MFLGEEYGFKVKHITQVISEKLDTIEFRKGAGKITYHDPCDLGRRLEVFDEPRQIIEKLGYELVEMEHNRNESRCCGGGGGILVSDQKTSEDVAKKRIEEAEATGADMLVTACATCAQTLRKASQHMDHKSVTVRDLNDILWKALK
jgi:Fe-S oxidoreductase